MEKKPAALDAAEAVLRQGELFGIFPEGTRNRDGRLYKGRTGAARLALKVGCPIFPVGVVGRARSSHLMRRCRSSASHAASRSGARSCERYRNRGDDHLVLRSIMDEVMYEIREMTGQEYCMTSTRARRPIPNRPKRQRSPM